MKSGLGFIALAIGALTAPASCQEAGDRTLFRLTPPPGFEAAPQEGLEALNAPGSPAFMEGSRVIGFFRLTRAATWSDYPHIIVRFDSVDVYATRSLLEASMRRAGVRFAAVHDVRRESLGEVSFPTPFEMGVDIFDNERARFWKHVFATAGSDTVAQVLGSQYYANGRLSVALIRRTDDSIEQAIELVSKVLDDVQPSEEITALEELSADTTTHDILPSTLFGNVILDWVIAGIGAGAVFVLSLRFPDESRAQRSLTVIAVLLLGATLLMHIFGRLL